MIKAVESRDRHHSEIGRGELPTPMLEGYRAVIYEQKTGKCAESFSHGLHRQTSTSLNCLRFSAVDRAWREADQIAMEYVWTAPKNLRRTSIYRSSWREHRISCPALRSMHICARKASDRRCDVSDTMDRSMPRPRIIRSQTVNEAEPIIQEGTESC